MTKLYQRKDKVPLEPGQVVRYKKNQGYYAGAPITPPTPYPGYLSPKQQLAQATLAATQSLAPSVLGANQAIGQTQTDARNQADASKAAYAALAKLQGDASNQVSSLYKTAGDTQAAYGKGFSDQVQGQLDAAAQGSNDLLSKMGSPQQLASEGPSAQSVLYSLGGYSPASVLNQEGAAFGAAAANLPSESYGLGIEGAKAATSQGNADVLKLRQQLATIQAQKPGLIQQALQQLQSGQAGLYNDFVSQTQRQQQLDLEAQAYGLNGDKFAYQQSKDQANFNNSVSRTAAQWTTVNGYKSDANGNPVLNKNGKLQPKAGYRLSPDGQSVVKTSAKTGKPFGSLTKTQVSTLRATAYELRYGTEVPKKDPSTGKPELDSTTGEVVMKFKPAMSYNKAVNFLVGHGYSRADAKAMLNQFYGRKLRNSRNPVVEAQNVNAQAGNDSTGLGIQITTPPL